MSDRAVRLPGLDVLRGIAIVWVMLFHSFLVGGLGPDWAWLSRFGWMGVDLFFVLSGFLIGCQVLGLLAQERGPPQAGFLTRFLADFYLRRALRILPAYWVVLLLYVLWPGFREAPGMEPAWKFLVFAMNLSIDYGRNAAFSHAWSLCVEEHFYWLFPPLALAVRRSRLSWKAVLPLGLLLLLGGMALRAAIWTQAAAADPGLSRNWFVEDLYYPTWNRLDGLLCGVALAAWKTLRPVAWQRAARWANLGLCAGLLVLALAMRLFQDRVGLAGNTWGWPVLSLGLGLLVFAGSQPRGLLGRLNLPLAGWLAGISYSLYLVHKPAYHLVQQHWGAALADAGLPPFLAFAAYGGAAVLAGAALHYAVERPFLRLRGKSAGEASRGAAAA